MPENAKLAEIELMQKLHEATTNELLYFMAKILQEIAKRNLK